MKRLNLAAALWAGLALSTANAAPPASAPPPITGGVRSPGGFHYPYGNSSPAFVRPYNPDASGVTGQAFGYQGNRNPPGAAPSRPRVVWYW